MDLPQNSHRYSKTYIEHTGMRENMGKKRHFKAKTTASLGPLLSEIFFPKFWKLFSLFSFEKTWTVLSSTHCQATYQASKLLLIVCTAKVTLCTQRSSYCRWKTIPTQRWESFRTSSWLQKVAPSNTKHVHSSNTWYSYIRYQVCSTKCFLALVLLESWA